MDAHHENNEVLDPETIVYNDLISSAKDFEKIELFGYAIKLYKQALTVKPNDEYSTSQLIHCKSTLKKDNKIIALIVVVAIIIVCIIILV